MAGLFSHQIVVTFILLLLNLWMTLRNSVLPHAKERVFSSIDIPKLIFGSLSFQRKGGRKRHRNGQKMNEIFGEISSGSQQQLHDVIRTAGMQSPRPLKP